MRKKGQKKLKKDKRKKKPKPKKEQKLRMLPTLREKRHYLVLLAQGKTKQAKQMQSAKSAINKAILDFVGTLGYAKAGPLFVESGKVNANQFYFILSVTTKHIDSIKAAIALLHERGLSVRCIGISGTIKKAREKFLSSLIA